MRVGPLRPTLHRLLQLLVRTGKAAFGLAALAVGGTVCVHGSGKQVGVILCLAEQIILDVAVVVVIRIISMAGNG